MENCNKVTVKLTNGNEVTELDASEGVCILVASADSVHDLGVADTITRGGLLAAALLNLPEDIFHPVIDFVQRNREKEKKNQLRRGNLIPFERR